jgi:hypothetical protein
MVDRNSLGRHDSNCWSWSGTLEYVVVPGGCGLTTSQCNERAPRDFEFVFVSAPAMPVRALGIPRTGLPGIPLALGAPGTRDPGFTLKGRHLGLWRRSRYIPTCVPGNSLPSSYPYHNRVLKTERQTKNMMLAKKAMPDDSML